MGQAQRTHHSWRVDGPAALGPSYESRRVVGARRVRGDTTRRSTFQAAIAPDFAPWKALLQNQSLALHGTENVNAILPITLFLVALLAALAGFDEKRLTLAAKAALKNGHTSGADFCAGLIYGCEAALKRS